MEAPSSVSSSNSFAAAASPYFDSLFRRRQQKKMSITETYYLAHTARKKLTREASRADHDLRLLVGHANLLDSLMVDLADAEHEQERWFNQTVHGAAKAQDEQPPKHIQWATTTIVEEPEEDWDPEDASDLDSDFSDEDEADDDDYDERDFVITAPPPRRRAPSPVAIIQEQELMEDESDDDDDTDSDFEYDDVEDLEQLSLTRSPSRASQSPPELLADSDDDSEDDNLPPSPPQPTIEVFNEKAAAVETTSLPSLKDNHLFEEQGYYVSQPPSHQEQTLIEAY